VAPQPGRGPARTDSHERRAAELRPRARRVAEQELRDMVRQRRLWFRGEREKQQLRDLLFRYASPGAAAAY
jgi:hypothetical protein